MLMVKHNGQSEEWCMRKRALMRSHVWLWGFQWEAGLELDCAGLGRRYCQPEEHVSAKLQLNKRQRQLEQQSAKRRVYSTLYPMKTEEEIKWGG